MRRVPGWAPAGLFVAAAALSASWLAGGSAAAQPDQEQPSKKDKGGAPAPRGPNDFAWALFRKVASKEKGNLVFSPFSIRTALSMVHAGARGRTAEQMAQVLCLPTHSRRRLGRVGMALVGLLAKLRPPAGGGQVEWRVANGLWVQKGRQVRPEFVAFLRDTYGARAAEVDFVRARPAARKAINTWVAKRTRNHITQVLPPGVLDPLTRFVVTNAVYFKGEWASRFPKANTQNMPFHLRRGVRATVPMMSQTHTFAYLAGPGFRALDMPYKGGDLSMIVLLPGKPFALADLCKALTAERLKALLARLRDTTAKVRVYLPRFTLACALRPKRALHEMGMRDAFSPSKADLTGISRRRPLWLDLVAHEACIEVSEEGTKAAAATAVSGIFDAEAAAREPKTIVFRADQPFLFLIRHKRTGGILFIGVVTNPK